MFLRKRQDQLELGLDLKLNFALNGDTITTTLQQIIKNNHKCDYIHLKQRISQMILLFFPHLASLNFQSLLAVYKEWTESKALALTFSVTENT